MENLPKVSIIIPTYNEEKHIARCLESLIANDYPSNLVEIIVVDGGSTDRTILLLNECRAKYSNIKIFENKNRTQSYAMNIGISNAQPDSKIIIRIDAHSFYPPDYVRKCVETLINTGADNVGGVMVPYGDTPFQKAVALAMSHPLGVGNAAFHLGGFSGEVDTVYLGCFKKDVFARVGLFDTNMVTNEDAELNFRITKSGGKIYLNSEIKVLYYPRDSWIKLVKQYFRYGIGRAQTTLKHKQVASYRQIVPALLLLYIFASLIGTFFARWMILGLVFYLGILWLVTISQFIYRESLKIWLLLLVIFPTMHIAWSVGFWNKIITYCILKNTKK